MAWLRSRGLQVSALLFALALVTRAIACAGSDGLGGQDPWAYLTAARHLGAWLAGSAEAPTGYFWPLGYPLLGALSAWPGGDEAGALRSVSLLTSSLAAPLVAASVSTLRPDDHGAAAAAGAVVALGGAAVVAGGMVMADAAMLFWQALALWATLRSLAGHGAAAALWAALAGLALGMAVVTRQAALVALLPLAAALLWHHGPHLRRPVDRRVAIATLGGFTLALALPLAAQWALDPGRPGAVDHAWLQSWRPWNAAMSSFTTVDGHADYAWPQGVFALFCLIHPGYLAPPGGLIAAAGLWRLRQERPAAIAIGGWLAIAVLLLAGMPHQNFRFGLCALAPAAVAFGVGVAHLRQGRDRAGTSTLLRAATALTLVVGVGWTLRMTHKHHEVRDQRRALVSAIAAEVAAVARAEAEARGNPGLQPVVVAFEVTLDLRGREQLETIDLSDVDAAQIAALREAARRRPLVLVLDDADLDGQWRGTAIAAARDRLLAAFAAGPPRRLGSYRIARLEPRR